MELSGTSASKGYAMGYALIMHNKIKLRDKIINDSKDIALELERFEVALRQTEIGLQQLITQLKASFRDSEAEMVEALLDLLHDDEFYLRILHKISEDHLEAEAAVIKATEEIVLQVQSMDNMYLLERSAEIRDICKRLINQLSGTKDWEFQQGDKKRILITDELTTSYSVQLDSLSIIGCASIFGGKTSHSAIIARSMGLPFVVGIGEQLNHIQDGQFIILDGNEGRLIVDPSYAQILFYERRKVKDEQDDMEPINPNVVSLDQHPIDLLANISSVDSIREAKRKGAAGVGLFRTEFIFLNRLTPPTEEEQFEIYREAALIWGQTAPVVIRTFDIGGDKQPLFQIHTTELNPLLGNRGIRVCLNHAELFKAQLRAILRASHYGQLKIMFPMIAILSEWREARAVVEAVKMALKLEGVAFDDSLEIGMMIEVPSAALNAEQFAREADFFSIGTNDLIQYLTAADRGNASLSYLNNGYEPTVLRLIKNVIEAASKHNIWVSLCGDMAGQPMAAALFLGMGIQKLSMNPNELRQVRTRISRVKKLEMCKHLQWILELSDAKEVVEYLENNS